MINNIPLKENSFISKKRRKLRKRILLKSKQKIIIYLVTFLGLVVITSFFITYNMYIYTNCKDLGFAVEYNFTSGFSSENKLLRVKTMSLVYYDGDTAIVEAFGLSKKVPHKSTSVKGSFKRDYTQHWIFEKFIFSD